MDTSFLFSGINFNRKKFAEDFARFEGEKETHDKAYESNSVENRNSGAEELKGSKPAKKRKRTAVVSEQVEGFNVFKSSNSASASATTTEQEDNGHLKSKKEMNRRIERDTLLRKKHNIHISGSNVPSPLQNFAELSSRLEF